VEGTKHATTFLTVRRTYVHYSAFWGQNPICWNPCFFLLTFVIQVILLVWWKFLQVVHKLKLRFFMWVVGVIAPVSPCCDSLKFGGCLARQRRKYFNIPHPSETLAEHVNSFYRAENLVFSRNFSEINSNGQNQAKIFFSVAIE
jgi:hypothetical protein